MKQRSTSSKANSFALKQKAHRLFTKKRYKEAARICSRLCAIDRSDVDASRMMGQIYNKLLMHEEAVATLRGAVAITPGFPELHHELGRAYLGLDRLEAAEKSLKTALSINRGLLDAYLDLGVVLVAMNKTPEALVCYGSAIQICPQSAESHYQLGTLLQSGGDVRKAIDEYITAIKLQPRADNAHAKLAQCFHSTGNLEKAEHHYRQSLKIRPNTSDIWSRLGAVLMLMGEFDEADVAFNKALAKKPDLVDAIAGKAQLLVERWDYQGAQALVGPLIEQRVLHVGLGRVFSRTCRHFRKSDEAISYLEEVCLDSRVATGHKLEAHYELGDVYDSLKEYDSAFHHYQRANDLQGYSSDAVSYAATVSQLIRSTTRETLHQLPRPGHDTSRPIFIVGMPRSGTTLVEQIISSHPEVHGAGELIYLGELAGDMHNKFNLPCQYPQCLPGLASAMIDRMSLEYLEKLAAIGGEEACVTDKMPHNFLHLGLVNVLFPQAKVIHCIRDPADTCLSIYFQKFNASHSYATDLLSIGMHYQQYQGLMQHWKQVLTIPVFDVQYEKLVRETESVGRKLLEFCGFEWNPACLDFHMSGRFVNTASRDQVKQPVHTGSIERWRRYERHIQPLLHLLGYLNQNRQG